MNHKASIRAYVIGFTLSVILTLLAYFAVTKNLFAATTLLAVIAVLAITQLIVQLVFLLHLGQEGKPRLTLMAFLFMLLVVFILVAGSLWIMHNLNYHMMPHEVEEYMFEEERIRP